MNLESPSDSLHRLVKHALDNGTAQNVAEAEAMFAGYRLAIEINTDAVDVTQQATLLTVVALARRVFLGGVVVSGTLSVPVSIPLPLGPTLADAVIQLGGSVKDRTSTLPTIVIGGGPLQRRAKFAIRTAAVGWRGGILPSDSELTPRNAPAMPLAGMLAAGLAVNEAFLHISGGMPAAGRRVLGLSLWEPSAATNWMSPTKFEPSLQYLPSQLWLLGLGHLGQAYLWGLGLLPYTSRRHATLVLQDIDKITVSTESTSILSDASVLGLKKTRAMADWAERRGFQTVITERRFAADFKRAISEPAIALCGLDNAVSRHALDKVGFDLVVEAGLGRGHRDFRTMRLHTIPGPRPAAEMWKAPAIAEPVEERPAYRELLADGVIDRCGVTLLAGKAVGAPFVGAVAASLALAEVLRLLHGGGVHSLVDIDLLSLDHRFVSTTRNDLSVFNPGFVMINPT